MTLGRELENSNKQFSFFWGGGGGVEAIQFKQLSMASENIEVVDEVNSFYTAGSL